MALVVKDRFDELGFASQAAALRQFTIRSLSGRENDKILALEDVCRLQIPYVCSRGLSRPRGSWLRVGGSEIVGCMRAVAMISRGGMPLQFLQGRLWCRGRYGSPTPESEGDKLHPRVSSIIPLFLAEINCTPFFLRVQVRGCRAGRLEF